MNVILFGATGMVGQGVLRECLRDDAVESVLAIGRSSAGVAHPKLRELVLSDMFAFDGQANLEGYDACFFCLGVSSAGMNEADYTRLTFDLTTGWARTLAAINPAMTFVYVSGAGTGGKSMWAQVKGRTESALLELFPNAYMFRLAALQPMNGEVSKTWKTVWLLRHGVVAMLASFYLGIWTGWMIITRTKSAGFHLPCVVRYTAYSQADEFGVVQALA